MEERPGVSCLLVTRGRPARAMRAIDCFASQDYENAELVIVSHGAAGHRVLVDYARAATRRSVVEAVVPETATLGAVRNVSVGIAGGEFVCQWDDDDLYHPQRVSRQLGAIEAVGADVCFMTDQLHYFERTSDLYWCDWQQLPPRGRSRGLIPNTLFCRRACFTPYPTTGSTAHRSEDAVVMRSLVKRCAVATLHGHGWLYVYVYHGLNTWDESHHLGIVRATALDARQLTVRSSQMIAALRLLPLGAVVVRDGCDAEIFAVP
mgnify:CR=1 FL=1